MIITQNILSISPSYPNLILSVQSSTLTPEKKLHETVTKNLISGATSRQLNTGHVINGPLLDKFYLPPVSYFFSNMVYFGLVFLKEDTLGKIDVDPCFVP